MALAPVEGVEYVGHTMMIFDKARENISVLQTGVAALRERADTGAPIHYMDAALGEGMIRHFPDGTRQRLLRIDGEFTVVETLEPGVCVEAR